jgi:hypothetical protein
MYLDDEKEKMGEMKTEEMGTEKTGKENEKTSSPGTEEYFSEVRERGEQTGETNMNQEGMSDESMENVGGAAKDEEYHSEIGRGTSGMEEWTETNNDLESGYFDTDFEEDEP